MSLELGGRTVSGIVECHKKQVVYRLVFTVLYLLVIG